jgi:pimeloyl-ACP methyl ester carboxylesterase
MSITQVKSRSEPSAEYARQSEKLSLASADDASDSTSGSTAVEAKFITPLDPVIQTADGNRLPAVPVDEAHKINVLKHQAENSASGSGGIIVEELLAHSKNGSDEVGREEHAEATTPSNERASKMGAAAIPPSRTHPLFPPLPLYGPPWLLRNLQCQAFRFTSFFLSTAFLAVIVLGSVFTSIPLMFTHIGLRLTFRNPDERRPFHEEEIRRKAARREASETWNRQRRRRGSQSAHDKEEDGSAREYEPLEGGPDPLVCDVAYYARRVGLDVEEFNVQTEDGFIITLWHVYNPSEYTAVPLEKRNYESPDVFTSSDVPGSVRKQYSDGKRRYPVLLMHGLLQSAGAYCTNDEDSLAFFLCKSGYDVWLGNNRCGFDPRHTLLQYHDPRMWAWNIRQMGVMDLPALISRVLSETGFEKLGLVCHSQGTTETFVALAKEQRPDLGDKISVFCALAPAVYAGPLIGKMYFKFMRAISPGMFRIFFGIHAFIPLMMTMHRLLPGTLYGAMGYRVFSFLFNWTDDRWERDLRDRMFQFAPVYVSSESMRWWLGRECFAKQKCILATKEEGKIEDIEDEEDEQDEVHKEHRDQGRTAWYDERAPPFALWIAGSDDLVDGRRLLRRFERGREPHVRLVKAKVIEEYEHLDVIWAMDSIEKVGKEVRDVIWETAPEEAYRTCRTPSGLQQEQDT